MLETKSVLIYSKGRNKQSTVKRHYIKWRKEQNPPMHEKCDNVDCKFNSEPLIWNGKRLSLILDHINGVSGDNRPENLQLLCPNCNSQQKTNGGGNKNKNIQSEGGFALVRDDGLKGYHLPAQPGEYKIN